MCTMCTNFLCAPDMSPFFIPDLVLAVRGGSGDRPRKATRDATRAAQSRGRELKDLARNIHPFCTRDFRFGRWLVAV
jgi:hypothetical protein